MSEAAYFTTEQIMEPYRDLLESALAHSQGTHLWEDIVEAVDEQDMFFWPGKNSAAITEVLDFPRKRCMHIFLAAGDMDELKEMEPCFVEFAKHFECDFVSLSGRAGWKKSLKDMGYEAAHLSLFKKVNHVR